MINSIKPVPLTPLRVDSGRSKSILQHLPLGMRMKCPFVSPAVHLGFGCAPALLKSAGQNGPLLYPGPLCGGEAGWPLFGPRFSGHTEKGGSRATGARNALNPQLTRHSQKHTK